MSASLDLGVEAEMAANAISGDEAALRVRLAAAYRILDFLGWTETIYGHVTFAGARRG